MAKRLTWMGLLVAVGVAGGATPVRAEEDDVLVVPLAPEGSAAESAAVAEDVRNALVRRGVGVLARPEARLDDIAPSMPGEPDLREVGGLARAMWTARDAEKPADVVELALRMQPLLEPLRTSDYRAMYQGMARRKPFEDPLSYMFVGACIDGVEALQVLGRLGEGAALLAMCADHPWLMGGLPAEVRPVFDPLLHAAELHVKTVPEGLPVRVAGNHSSEVREVWPVRVRDGGRFPVTVSCPQPRERRRVHWVDVVPGARALSVEVDCDLDAAVHTDGHGLWLSSSAYVANEHVRALGRLVGAGRVLTVERGSGRFALQFRAVGSKGRGAAVTLPAAYSSRELERALDGLLAERPAAEALATAAPTSAPAVPPPPSSARPWTVWSGAALLVAGAGLDVAAWSVARHRADRADSLARALAPSEGSRQRWWGLRGPMYSLGGAAAAVGAGGAALIATGLPGDALPWWTAATAGAAGGVLAVWGAVEVARGERCDALDVRNCALAASVRDRGGVLLATAAPFLALPLAKWVRLTRAGGTEDKAEVAVSVAPQGVTVWGRW
jgi:hypothetical protein